MTIEQLTPPKAANRLSKILAAFAAAHGAARFPVDVEHLAKDCHQIFGWSDPISEITSADLPGFEGALVANETRTRWLMLYNREMASPGRVRFTQAHELGHYVLHRLTRDTFECAHSAEMRNWVNADQDFERQADEFASYLLMPLDDFRAQLASTVNLAALSHCADRYGVSLTAAALKWVTQTSQKAVLILSNDGFMHWAWSSDAAAAAGAFFRTRSTPVALPAGSLATEGRIERDQAGRSIPVTVWFPYADPGLALQEMKITSKQHGDVLTLLVLPAVTDAWPPYRRA